jgi:HAD superfamily hydrolase (TIGR01484 family)
MRPLDEFRADSIDTVFADIDDTLTTDGALLAKTYYAIEQLHRAGFRVVPVTGRPAGWCDHIARLWPVDGVIGENGAFYYWQDRDARKLRQRHIYDESTRCENGSRLAAIRDEILRTVPGCAVASDQFCRQYDLAIDFCEDVAPLREDEVDRIVELMQRAGMTAKVSSIHVNGWFGDYDKLSMVERFVEERWDESLDELRTRSVFAGDSPNDEPMFAYFPHSVGMANVMRFTARMTSLPAYITRSPGGHGFVELAECLLTARGIASTSL